MVDGDSIDLVYRQGVQFRLGQSVLGVGQHAALKVREASSPATDQILEAGLAVDVSDQ
ncbi:hypothetical protein [Brachybacterium alimentarium]|uniref:hypothetical protein n=1 Tax=Brachybacterium alimentarium TaxID=47845 RepID=UPI0015F08CF6|nr:hypothetical protein [Brachybacterium alimentarium]